MPLSPRALLGQRWETEGPVGGAQRAIPTLSLPPPKKERGVEGRGGAERPSEARPTWLPDSRSFPRTADLQALQGRGQALMEATAEAPARTGAFQKLYFLWSAGESWGPGGGGAGVGGQRAG